MSTIDRDTLKYWQERCRIAERERDEARRYVDNLLDDYDDDQLREEAVEARAMWGWQSGDEKAPAG